MYELLSGEYFQNIINTFDKNSQFHSKSLKLAIRNKEYYLILCQNS